MDKNIEEPLNPDDFIGFFIDKICPECGAQLLTNRIGDEWCSYYECDYGCVDFYNQLGINY